MSLFGRAATLIGLAAGGAAAARAVASLTPSERQALYDVLTAGLDLIKQQASRLSAPRPDGLALPEPRDRYRAGPLQIDDRPELPPGLRGAHGEPPPGEVPERFAAASRAFDRRMSLALDTEQLRKNLLNYQRTWRRQRDAAIDELPATGDVGPAPVDRAGTPAIARDVSTAHGPASVDQSVDPHAVHAEPTPTETPKATAVARFAPLPALDEAAEAEFQRLRHRFASIKDDVLAGLDAYLDEFARNAERAGATIYRARDADDANRYVTELARRLGVDQALKSKSMVSEEIHLNHALEEAGVHPVETDFGEWIAQLDRDRPGHMISPIAHKNRYEVGDAISAATGVHTTGEDIPEMARIAREQLRKDFIAGELGISGANALIASTGAIMLVTNEGNGRLVSSLPRVHVAICGAEKLVPDMPAAAMQLRLLGRSGTGQSQTVYTTFKSGPDRPDGEMHVVLLDNGRSKMLADPDFDDALRCIRCGACANVCPPYAIVSGHAFGYVYAGAIGLVTTPFHHGLENDADAQSLCLQCNACATVCPVEIPLPRQILDVRRRVVETAGLPPFKRALTAIWREPKLFDRLARAGASLASALASETPLHGRLLTRLPLPAAQAWRTPPAPAPVPARDSLQIPEPAREGPLARSGARGLTVAYFVQCLTDRLFPEMAQATVEVLAACGARVVVPPGQHCCGLICHDAGDRVGAVALAKGTVEALEKVAAHWIVTGGASCAIAVLHDFEHIFADEPEWAERARRMAGRTLDFTSFLHEVAQLPTGALAPALEEAKEVVTYHSFCGSTNLLNLHEAPRRLISEVLGCELREMEEAGVCCGFGGSFSADHPNVARLVAERKMANIDAAGAPVVVTDNPGCIAHLRGALHASDRPVQVLHMAELVARRLRSG